MAPPPPALPAPPSNYNATQLRHCAVREEWEVIRLSLKLGDEQRAVRTVGAPPGGVPGLSMLDEEEDTSPTTGRKLVESYTVQLWASNGFARFKVPVSADWEKTLRMTTKTTPPCHLPSAHEADGTRVQSRITFSSPHAPHLEGTGEW
ncbi:hypothetical protein M378DRAFT_8148 [Amanita muscaria Koide BX008]|uniref:Uncharacterized protein n=1 Tax=Amanita muscaria (strain Koide BX008) TaxID=946122 RepID=A0A0C2X3D3_AMAMK|nr:hypothetical protein M378DRAFT_8148 [Amanita muscaria Koide BX008]